jgi:ERCC4-related helicase
MIIDNKANGKIGEELRKNITKNARLSVISSLFSIYGYSELKTELEKTDSFRLLLPQTSYQGKNRIDNELEIRGLTGSEVDRRFRNTLNLTQIARECAEWLSRKAEIKAVAIPIPQNLFQVAKPDGENIAIYGSSPFSTAGLGFTPSNSFDMNTLTSGTEAKNLLKWFDSIWNSPEEASDIKKIVLKQLENIFSDKSPRLIYFLILYNIFKDFLGEIEEENIIKTRTGIKDTLIWSKLYKFQRDGVLGAIDKIEKYNGCIIADSVGLGKTFEALAIIKYYELRNDRVLVLCPKKLRENWTLYTINDKRNILAEDRFNYDVLNHTDLSRTKGLSGEINLETLNWGNYDLVVIDESHNFRNNPSRKDGVTRYSRLMRDIIKAGVKTKVLMLSATPVNNRMNDLKNQVAFITEGRDDSLNDHGIISVEQTLKKAQTRFNQWLKKEESQRTTESLLETLNFDYFKLLDLLTIARSRKHIEKYYDINEIGRFPERLKPINIKADIDTEDRYPPLREINRDIRRLNLSAYSPLKYVLPQKMEEYSRKYDMQLSGGSVFKQIDREESLIHLLRVNLLKRMESSINSFSLTLEKLLYEVRSIIERIDAHEEMEVEELSIEDLEIEDEEFTPFVVGNKIKVLIQDVDIIRWRQELSEDEELLVKLLNEAQEIKPEQDAKLLNLKNIIREKANSPINPNNRKIIIFTAFADTARYLYQNIASWAKDSLGLYCALVTGTGDNKTTMPGIRKDMASIITSFSPISKERGIIDPTLKEEIDILIATDCISEGQNLQDCDYLVNYDIHWNPVRIIQRFGRIDRLGSKNNAIQLVNFWPNMELDEYINLEARVSGRMVLLDISATGEENVIEFSDAGKMNDLEYRRKQLEKLQNEVVDIEDLGGSISITDLTLNDFRMDLADYLKENRKQLEQMPHGIFAVVRQDELLEDELEPGVIFCLRSENDRVQTDSTYALSPYYLVYVSDSGEICLNFTHSKKILDILKKSSFSQKDPDKAALAQFNQFTRNARDMSHYQNLLGKAVFAITGKAEEHGVESLFQRGGTVLSKGSFRGIEDFEVVAYLIILGEDVKA